MTHQSPVLGGDREAVPVGAAEGGCEPALEDELSEELGDAC